MAATTFFKITFSITSSKDSAVDFPHVSTSLNFCMCAIFFAYSTRTIQESVEKEFKLKIRDKENRV